jgi:4-diphosphocytidyl-2-C-methyl-D-erythritol kinase
MILFPNCKINLGLNVISKRPDGYHNLETVFYPVPLHDALEIIPAGDGSSEFHSSGLEIPGDDRQNLCVRAFRMLQAEYKLPEVKMHLHKVIPMGAGLGGGSSDGAFTLKLLNGLFDLQLTDDRLREFAGQLGSDCPFFIENMPVLATGRGNRFSPCTIDLKGYRMVIVKPGVHVATADAYALLTPSEPVNPLAKVISQPVETWKGCLVNDFERTVFENHPVIGEIRKKLYDAGAVYASMSGSGSAVYGLFAGITGMEELFPDCFTWSSPPL